MSRPVWVVCSLIAAIAGAHATEVASQPKTSAPTIRLLGLEVKDQEPGKMRDAGATLPINRDVAVKILLEGPGHVYLVKSNTSAKSQTLFPMEGADSMHPAGSLRIPDSGSWLKLPPIKNQEEICVLVTAEALAESARLCPELPLGRRPDEPEPKPKPGDNQESKGKPKDSKGPGQGAHWLRSIRITVQS